jgi:hypothetical protein
MDGAAWRGGACIARGHAALDASGQAAAGGYARCGARTSPFVRVCARGHSRSSRQHPRTSGRPHGHPVGSGANAVRAGCPIASPRDGAPTGEKGSAPHVSANREKNPRIRWQRLTILDPRSAHASGADGFARWRSLNRFNKMSVALMIALALVSTRTGRPLFFSTPFGGVFGAFLQPIFEIFGAPLVKPDGTRWWQHRSVRVYLPRRREGPTCKPHGAPEGRFTVAGPIVRIHLPPVGSQSRT